MKKKNITQFSKYLIIGLVSLLIIIPFYDMVINSFKTQEESTIPNLSLPTKWQIVDNYETVIEKGKLVRSFFNSLLITGVSSFFIIVVSTMAAFVFGRRKEKGVRMWFFLFLLGIITPPSLIVSTLMLKYMGLLGTYQGMILYYISTFSPLPIFILTGFMATVPREIEEAAVIDGASPMGVFLRVVLPLMRPAIATAFIYTVLKIWNDFLFPMYILAGDTKKYTMILSLFFFKGQFYTAWNLVFADLILVSLPVLVAFLFAQRSIVKGLTAGALKG